MLLKFSLEMQVKLDSLISKLKANFQATSLPLRNI